MLQSGQLEQIIQGLRSTLAKMDNALATIDESIILVDAEARIKWCNAAFERLTEIPRIELFGKRAPGVLPLRIGGEKISQEHHPALPQTHHLERYSYLAHDETRYLDIAATRIQDEGGTPGGVITIRDVTESIEMDEARLARAALNAAANAILITDATGRILWCNPAFTDLTGYTAEESIGNSPAMLRSGVHPSSFYEAMYQEIFDGKVWKGEVVNRRKDGTLYNEEQTITPVINSKGHITHFIAIKEDIDARKAAERAVLRQNSLLDTIMAAQSHFIAATSRTEFFERLLSGVLDIADSEYGFIGEVLYKEGAPYLKTFAITNIAWNEDWAKFYEEHAPSGMEFTNLDTLFGEVLRTGETLIANAPDEHPSSGGRPAGHPPLNAFLGIALKIGGQFVGMIGLANRPDGYDDKLINYLEPLTSTCASLIMAYRMEELRIRAQKELEMSEARLSAILKNAVDSIVVIDDHGRIEQINPALESMFGYSASEVLGKNVNILMPEPYKSGHDQYLRNYLETGIAKIIGIGRELPARRKDGSLFTIELAVSEVRMADRMMFTAIIRDVSERKAQERALGEMNDKLQAKQQHIADDLRAAGEIQKSLLPKKPPKHDALDVAWYFKPSADVGGDVFLIDDLGAGRYAFSMIDVSGHGVPSSLVSVSISQRMEPSSLIRSDGGAPLPPATVLQHLDRDFPMERFGKYFTIFYMVLDANTGSLRYSAAGHPPAIHLKADGTHSLLEEGGSIVGLGGIIPFEEGEVTLAPGDFVVLYTDGITEYESREKEFYGMDRFISELQELKSMPPLVICSRIWESLMIFGEGSPPDDDVSLLVVEFKGPSS